jgi:lipopolysaccharide export system permease protein
MIRLIDRYVLSIFLPALGLFTVTLLFLFIAVDCAAKLGKFLEIKEEPVLRFIVSYYLYRIPMLLTILIPSVMIFAPTFTVIKLARSNELLPIATCGTSLRRMALPFMVAAVLAALSMASLEEWVMPLVGDKIVESDQKYSGRRGRFNVQDYDGQTKLWAAKLDSNSQVLTGGDQVNVRFTLLDADKHPEEVITARRAQWDEKLKRWVAFDGFIDKPKEDKREPGQKPRPWKEPIPPEGYVIESKLSPETLRKDVGITGRYSVSKLQHLIQEMRRYPHVPTNVLMVHSRFSFPLSPIVLLLVGLPFVMDPHSKSFIKGLIFCFILALSFYVVHFACVDLGSKGSMPPVLAAWLPVTTFGAIGLFSFYRMKT